MPTASSVQSPAAPFNANRREGQRDERRGLLLAVLGHVALVLALVGAALMPSPPTPGIF